MKSFNLATHNKEKALAVREEIRKILQERPGIRNYEIADIVGMSKERVGDHVAAIREEWRERV